ncbi:hypothetical protein BS17DRAFT_828069 [Gyrodon lividus]|nr:hypothetical protein BS17DRAFT_828069 [Gyrodon lividus]
MASMMINKTDTIKVLGNVIFLEVDGITPDWHTYQFDLDLTTPGKKTIVVFCLKDSTKQQKGIPDPIEQSVLVKTNPMELICLDDKFKYCKAKQCLCLPQVSSTPKPATPQQDLNELSSMHQPWHFCISHWLSRPLETVHKVFEQVHKCARV